MKTMLLRQLFIIQEALESYCISVEPVMDAVQSTLGLAVMHAGYRTEITQDGILGDRFSGLLGDIANMVTVAGALPAAISAALGLLSK